ncbi:TorD/DmsD family molecular chaperone [Desulfitobacterium sp. AusDCA]|uniref:TorD/DmsD family molecular chaperone n=1 Tax=Desulfitobacterium sp. AusDCA TaxID=3240383 RepID=UPI003DA750CE
MEYLNSIYSLDLIDNREENISRAVLYNLFASLLARKTDDTWLNPDFQRQLLFGLPESEGKVEILGALKKALKKPEDYQEFQLDFDQLFIVPGPNLTFPYESCYTHRNVDGTFGRLWQEPAQDMQRILKEWKLEFAEGWNLIPDHISVELFFMAELCHRCTTAEKSQYQALRNWQINFFNKHLRVWGFEFVECLTEKAQTDFYRGVSKLLREFLTEEKEGLVLNNYADFGNYSSSNSND